MSPQARDATIQHFSMLSFQNSVLLPGLGLILRMFLSSEQRTRYGLPRQLKGRWRCAQLD